MYSLARSHPRWARRTGPELRPRSCAGPHSGRRRPAVRRAGRTAALRLREQWARARRGLEPARARSPRRPRCPSLSSLELAPRGLVGVERSPYCTSRPVDRDGLGSHLPATCSPLAGSQASDKPFTATAVTAPHVLGFHKVDRRSPCSRAMHTAPLRLLARSHCTIRRYSCAARAAPRAARLLRPAAARLLRAEALPGTGTVLCVC